MKKECEMCSAKLAPQDEAYICSYECTFCKPCTDQMQSICPNCGGELLRRPGRKLEAG